MSTTSTMASSRGLLQLPSELLLNVAAHLVGDDKDIHRARHLLSLALVCRQLAPVAREALCVNPILETKRVAAMLRFLFAHPELAAKVKTLTIENAESGNGRPHEPIIHLDQDLRRQCKRHIESLPVLPLVRNKLKSWLDRSISIVQLLLTLLPTVLPNIDQLYLGGTVLNTLPCVQALIANKIYPRDIAISRPLESDLELALVVQDIAPKLTALELPVNMWRWDHYRHEIEAPRLVQLPTVFSRLRWLSVPHMAILPIIDTLRKEGGLQSLKTLVLTDVFCACPAKKFTTMLLEKEHNPSLLPRLSEVKLYHRSEKFSKQCVGDPGDEHSPQQLARVGIQVYEYIPRCCLRIGDEYHHPWKYTKSEIDARQDERHRKFKKSPFPDFYCGCDR